MNISKRKLLDHLDVEWEPGAKPAIRGLVKDIRAGLFDLDREVLSSTLTVRVEANADGLMAMIEFMTDVVGDQRIPDHIRTDYAVRLRAIREQLDAGPVAHTDGQSKLHQVVARQMGAGDQYEEVE